MLAPATLGRVGRRGALRPARRAASPGPDRPGALYRELRAQITRFYLRGGDAFSLEKLEALARG